MNRKVICFAVFFVLFSPYLLIAQGCSDAGFCTMGAMKPDQKFTPTLNLKLRSIEVGQYVGLTRFDDVILAYNVDFNLAINAKTTVQVKLPYQIVDGPLARTNGLGDISLSLTRNLVSKSAYQLNVTLGGKIPTGNPTKLDDRGRALPMYYQSTLGTYDVVVGLSIITRKWLIATGYQQAINQINNQFVWGLYDPTNPANSDISEESFENVIKKYPVSRNLYRGKDLMLRVERNFRFSKFNVNLGMLYIYRLNRDRIERGDLELITDKSNGLAWTGLVGLGYRISPKSSLKMMNGFRIIKRDFNPDGLSREFVNTIGYELKF